MTPWAKWTAKTVLLTTGFAAAGGGLPGVAFAGAGGTNAGNVSVLSGNLVSTGQNRAPVSIPISVCGSAAAVLGDSSAGCAGGATAGDWVRDTSSKGRPKAAGKVGKSGKAGKSRKTSETRESKRRTSHHPTKTQLAGLGVLPGIATVPGLGDVTSLSPLAGLTGGGALMPASTLSAYQQNYRERALPGTTDGGMSGGMSGGSFATLAVGALLAGAAALKLASRRPRDRRTGAGQVSA